MKAAAKLLACGLFAWFATPASPAGTTYTYPDLVKRLYDLEALAVLPAPGERCAQWSSYDRASRYDEATGKYVRWDANGDGGGIIRKENGKLVLAEMTGPGCIWRIWSARPERGRVQIYLDGAAQPAIDLPFIAYFDRKHEPFTRPTLVHTVARGWNNYTPIPYQKSCKIVAEPGWGAYYQFVYGTFPKGTRVPTFRMNLDRDSLAALDRADRVLSAGDRDPAGRRPGQGTVIKSVTVTPGRSVEVLELTGPRAISSLRAKLDLPPSPEDHEVLRELALSIHWDGEAQPSVWAPFGDFFGTAAGANPYRSLPSGLTREGWWYCYWYMPFERSARLTLTNDGDQRRTVTFEITHAPLTRPIAQLGRFHLKWHRDAFLPSEPERAIDWTLLKTQGRGRYCGVMLHVWNPRGSWWGEGDEKFFVDGEKFPSTFGTGSEDYFGYAWCTPELFENAFHNQTIAMNNKGHVCVNRWHIADNVPFQRSFEGCIEKYFPNRRPTLYASTVYWYLAPDGHDPHTPRPITERVGYWYPITNFVVKGALEGERLKILSCSGGRTLVQDMSGFDGDWSRDQHLWWIEAHPGDRLELALPVSQAGRYQMTLTLTKARDYGIVQLYLNGRKLEGPIDLYHPTVISTGPMDLGLHALSSGTNTLTIEIVGANAKAVKAYMFGLDYVLLTPKP